MPEVIKGKFEFPTATAFGGQVHDWPTIFDGKVRRFAKDVDFTSTPENFASTARQVATYKYHKIAKTLVEKDADGNPTGTVVIQAVPMTDEQVEAHEAKIAARKAAKAASNGDAAE
jgi:sRNA-binding protein